MKWKGRPEIVLVELRRRFGEWLDELLDEALIEPDEQDRLTEKIDTLLFELAVFADLPDLEMGEGSPEDYFDEIEGEDPSVAEVPIARLLDVIVDALDDDVVEERYLSLCTDAADASERITGVVRHFRARTEKRPAMADKERPLEELLTPKEEDEW